MIMQPSYVTRVMFELVFEQVQKKKGFAALSRILFETYDEGL